MAGEVLAYLAVLAVVFAVSVLVALRITAKR